MELRHLRCFLAVAEELHFAHAAEKLHMEQSPLSHGLRPVGNTQACQRADRERVSRRSGAPGGITLAMQDRPCDVWETCSAIGWPRPRASRSMEMERRLIRLRKLRRGSNPVRANSLFAGSIKLHVTNKRTVDRCIRLQDLSVSEILISVEWNRRPICPAGQLCLVFKGLLCQLIPLAFFFVCNQSSPNAID